jgi:hypothetical protein
MLFTIEIVHDSGTHTITQDVVATFEKVDLLTIREKNENRREDLWRGFYLRNIIDRFDPQRWDTIEFLSDDNYMVRLSKSEIEASNPIMAISRNGVDMPAPQKRLVSGKLAEMFWIANITRVTFYQNTRQKDIIQTISAQELLPRLRLYRDPAPFVNVTGYKVSDIVTYFALDSDFDVRIVTKDGIEQVLPYQRYFRDAYIMRSISDNVPIYRIMSEQMPTGMWMNYIQSINLSGHVVEF